MGRRLGNWLANASRKGTRAEWVKRWRYFTSWVVAAKNPLTDRPYLECAPEQVDDRIRSDFETLPFHLFQDKYRGILRKYVVHLQDCGLRNNTVGAYVSSVRSFFESEASEIKLGRNRVPPGEMASGEHRFNREELARMWLVGNVEGKARLSVAVSLGWSVGDFSGLTKAFIAEALGRRDGDGYAVFDYRRKKTGARVRGILNPSAVADLEAYLPRVPDGRLWSIGTRRMFNLWLKGLVKEAGIRPNGTVRFHLLRKYTYDVASAQCGQYEAKLLVGKAVPMDDQTYLHGLEDRLLDRYKRLAYPFLNLAPATRTVKASELEAKFRQLEATVMALVRERRGGAG